MSAASLVPEPCSVDHAPCPQEDHDHDHRHCISDALAVAESRCAAAGVRLTPLRRRVLELVWRSHAPLGAYTVLEAMQEDSATPVAPPTVYRALDFLMAQGLVHKLQGRNSYIGCPHPQSPHPVQFLICSRCGRVVELTDLRSAAALTEAAAAQGFTVTRQIVELEGLCRDCQSQPEQREDSPAR